MGRQSPRFLGFTIRVVGFSPTSRLCLKALVSGFVFGVAAHTAWAGPYSARDWARCPAIVERDQPATVFAVGDIHGDYERLVRLLATARIVPAKPATPERGAWSARDSVLVVVGDMIDKGPRPVEVLRLLRSLQIAARKQQGEVIVLAGNHEAELLAAPNGAPSAARVADLEKFGMSSSGAPACRGEIGEFLCSLPFGARVGDWFFSHAGDTGGRTIQQLSTQIQDGAYDLTAPNSILEARLGQGRKWFAPPGPGVGERQVLASYAMALGVKHMVQGHQHNEVKFADGAERHTGEMFQRWGLLFLIDVGMSREIGDSQGAVLRIGNARAAALCPDGKETLLWDAQGDADLGRAAPCVR
jgi:hypothetical protein